MVSEIELLKERHRKSMKKKSDSIARLQANISELERSSKKEKVNNSNNNTCGDPERVISEKNKKISELPEEQNS